ncbi:Probable N-acetylmuramoyl-L-alanine amidase [Oceanicola granulosus HTCC2516]|uniref:N-acetylmuramoyl-L-alanine amidase n=1 Tax=Oceanicola granulosus (strain ATCC BAA-861 / DSM 15982 / KCTC 12143 / HTCC2516) TaxID=314256 RepID=Q2C9P5_OCEGH|nr:N-acetylmuramoyl-L-alanine amidase [Oceanicola granulosus]EAR49393.1 Probable N-acetylmuramoyl-L-alanine amidase [Oceanicola granulosus HTCC2516]
MIRALCLLLCLALPAAAQDFSALARLDPARSSVRAADGEIAVDLALSQPVPWRVFTLDAPRRLVLDFREVDWGGAGDGLLSGDAATDVQTGRHATGWSRMVVTLAAPFEVASAGMVTDAATGEALVQVRLTPTDAAAFAARAGAPDDAATTAGPDVRLPAPPPRERGVIAVAIDPGHGGVDPGAERDGTNEADLMLRLALELAEAVARAGMVPVLTRSEDAFVPLQTRMTIAREAGADLFLSLHADALEEAEAHGATVYTLSDGGGDRASARLAERHDRSDLLGGVDLTGQDDTVATILMDLARLETGPSGERLADALVAGLDASGARLNSRPRREAMLAVLRAADFPSVLVEVGFLSSDTDRARLLSPEGRGQIVDGLVRGIQAWAAEEAALAPLLRQ